MILDDRRAVLVGGAAFVACSVCRQAGAREGEKAPKTFDTIAFCGLDCSKCDAYLATIRRDDALRAEVATRWKMKPEQIVAEVREARRHWRTAQIGFADDNMFVQRRHSRRLVEALRDERFTWYAQTDVSVAEDPALLRGLHDAGCRILLIGFESASPHALEGLDVRGWKRKMFERYGQFVERIQGEGIGVYGAFIFGLDPDDESTIDRTIDFVQANNLMGAQVTLLTPFPGSRLRLRLQAEGRILHSDWQWYTAWNPVIRHPRLSAAQMQDGLLRFYQSIYSQDSFVQRNRHFRAICEALVRRQAAEARRSC